jgi:hypothetical protein
MEPGIGGVAYDAEHPGAGGVRAISCQPVRQTVTPTKTLIISSD